MENKVIKSVAAHKDLWPMNNKIQLYNVQEQQQLDVFSSKKTWKFVNCEEIFYKIIYRSTILKAEITTTLKTCCDHAVVALECKIILMRTY